MKLKLVSSSFFLALFLLAAASASTPAFAQGALCTADPSTVVVGTKVTIVCTGFSPNVQVNAYIVDPTGFVEIGSNDYSACLVNGQNGSGTSGKTDESGTVTFYWYTQNGAGNGPSLCTNDAGPGRDYRGYSNQLGTYVVVVQQNDTDGNVIAGKVSVTLMGNGQTFGGAILLAVPPIVRTFGTITFVGAGFVPNEAVNLWLTRPADCSGHGWDYWTGTGAFSPQYDDWGFLSGIHGQSTVKADEAGSFAVPMTFGDLENNETPCLGTWALTAHALGSDLGAVAEFQVVGRSVASSARVFVAESSVPSQGQHFDCHPEGCGVAVHVSGTGFPPSSYVNCWFTRPDGTTYIALGERGFFGGSGDSGIRVDDAGNFSAYVGTFTSDNGYQADQPGRWAITCATPDQSYLGIANFDVFALPDP